MWKLLQGKCLLVLQFKRINPSIPFDTRMSMYNAYLFSNTLLKLL